MRAKTAGSLFEIDRAHGALQRLTFQLLLQHDQPLLLLWIEPARGIQTAQYIERPPQLAYAIALR